MPVPSLVTDLTSVASGNFPVGADAVFPDLDNYLRAHAGFIKQNYDTLSAKANTSLLTAYATLSALASTSTTTEGDALVGVKRTAANAVATTLHTWIEKQAVNVKADYGATGDGVTDDRAAIQACLNANPGKPIYFPPGTYLVSSAINVTDLHELYGAGKASIIKATTDIEIIAGANLDTAFLSGVYIHDLHIQSTKTSPTTKYQIHLRNALLTRIERCHVQSGLPDTPPSATDVAGIKLDKTITGAPAGSGSYINWIVDNFIQNAGVLIDSGAGGGVTDGVIRGNYIYGHPCAHSLKFVTPTGNWIVDGNNFTSPDGSAAIWINGGAIDHIRIVGNFFDGNPTVLNSGYGVHSDAGAPRATIVGNSFWAMGRAAIRAVDPIAWTISGNTFLDNNDDDGGHSDIEIVGSTFQPNRNTIVGNVFQQQAARVSAGYAIKEINSGFGPVQNTYGLNTIVGNASGYLGGVLVLAADASASKKIGNVGFSSETEYTETYTPTWASSGTQPALGNGTLTGRRTRSGNLMTVEVKLTAGSTTTFGTGYYTFSTGVTPVTGEHQGSASAVDASVSTFYDGACQMPSGLSTIQALSNGGVNNWGQTVPFTWATSDTLTLSISFPVA